MEELIAYLEKENAERREWMNAGPDRWASQYVTDPKFWEECGITTLDEFLRQEILQSISDLHKSAYGFRSRTDYSDWTYAALLEEVERMGEASDRAVREEREREEYQLQQFEDQVARNIELGAPDRSTAIRWIVDGLDIGCQWDADYVCYCLGLSYSNRAMIEEAVGDYLKQKRDEMFEAMMEEEYA